MVFPETIARRSLKCLGQDLLVEVRRYDELQSFPVPSGQCIGVFAEYIIDGGSVPFIKAGLDATSFGSWQTDAERADLVCWIPKAGFNLVVDVLAGRRPLAEPPVYTFAVPSPLVDPQRTDMASFRKRCRYDLLRVIRDAVTRPQSPPQFRVSDALASTLLTRLYERDDLDSAATYWYQRKVLTAVTFDGTCVVNESMDEDIEGLIRGYSWEESSVLATGAASPTDFDLFICHASEDKAAFVHGLADALIASGLKVWYDDIALKLGDSLRRVIDSGLSRSRYGVVVLSHAFFEKNWPQYELDALVQRENSTGSKVILPVWHGVSKDDVAGFSLSLAGRVAASSQAGVENVVKKIREAIALA